MSAPRIRSRAPAAQPAADLAYAAQTQSPPSLTALEKPPDLATLYRQNAGKVARWAGRLNGPEGDLEDIVQEVFIIAQRGLPQWRGDAKITTWLYEITLRVVRDRRRYAKWRRWLFGRREPGAVTAWRDELANIPAEQPGPLELLVRRESAETLYRILDGMADRYRTVLVLFELEGLSGEEIAKVTGMSLANVWIRLFRARKKFMQGFLAWERRRKQ
ncbi:MAG: hypothetical protein QOI66_3672 [Myxococcales bacterium]|jgi:RNA polymerase sigma-70 factor (ECF subfamily)|nr:hypothetical protein [Myxococcales bacterium]